MLTMMEIEEDGGIATGAAVVICGVTFRRITRKSRAHQRHAGASNFYFELLQ